GGATPNQADVSRGLVVEATELHAGDGVRRGRDRAHAQLRLGPGVRPAPLEDRPQPVVAGRVVDDRADRAERVQAESEAGPKSAEVQRASAEMAHLLAPGEHD